MFDTLKQAQQWIESVEKFSDKYDLSRMQKACAMLSFPQDEFKSIHIGGTNGKGSTLQMIHRVLMRSGYRVGTFTSPYIVHFNERITLGGVMISDEDLLHYINIIYAFQEDYKARYDDQITFFEMLSLISFLYFRDSDVDIVLYEVGLGGTLDATNVITPLIAIITSIGYDHMNVLGNTLESIATNKLGIVKAGVPLISGVQQDTLVPLFTSHAAREGSAVYFTKDMHITDATVAFPTSFVHKGTAYTLAMHGTHQINNALIAIQTAEILRDTYGYTISTTAISEGLSLATMPGRFEHIGKYILDGAHNISGLEASLETLRHLYPHTPVRIVFGVMADKDYVPMLKAIAKVAQTVILSEIPYGRSEKAEILKTKITHPSARVIADSNALIDELQHSAFEGVTLITGSFYFISTMRRMLIETT